MQSLLSLIMLVLIGISVAAVYVFARRGRARTVSLLIIGSMIDVVLFGVFALAQNDPPVQAVVVALVLGIVFNTLTVLGAIFFRRNEQERARQPVR